MTRGQPIKDESGEARTAQLGVRVAPSLLAALQASVPDGDTFANYVSRLLRIGLRLGRIERPGGRAYDDAATWGTAVARDKWQAPDIVPSVAREVRDAIIQGEHGAPQYTDASGVLTFHDSDGYPVSLDDTGETKA